jgi:hypothetical protein
MVNFRHREVWHCKCQQADDLNDVICEFLAFATVLQWPLQLGGFSQTVGMRILRTFVYN